MKEMLTCNTASLDLDLAHPPREMGREIESGCAEWSRKRRVTRYRLRMKVFHILFAHSRKINCPKETGMSKRKRKPHPLCRAYTSLLHVPDSNKKSRETMWHMDERKEAWRAHIVFFVNRSTLPPLFPDSHGLTRKITKRTVWRRKIMVSSVSYLWRWEKNRK